MKTKVCHISTVHKKDDIRIFHKECRALKDAGYDVVYISGGTHCEYSDGIKLLGSGVSAEWKKIKRMTEGCRLTVKKALKENADIYHIHDGELSRYIKKIKKPGKKVVYDSHEHLPMQIYEKEWIPKLLRPIFSKIAGIIEVRNVKKADLVIVVADVSYDRFKPLGIDMVKLENLPIFNEFANMKMDLKVRKENRKICYTGAVWMERGLDTMCKAATGIEDMVFEIAGRIDIDNPEKYIKSIGGNIKYSGFMSRQDVVKLYEESFAGLCLFKPYPNNMIDSPTKIYEYMAAGIPVIASDFESMKSVVKDTSVVYA